MSGEEEIRQVVLEIRQGLVLMNETMRVICARLEKIEQAQDQAEQLVTLMREMAATIGAQNDLLHDALGTTG